MDNYRLITEPISQSQRSCVRRAFDTKNNIPVILKICNQTYPSSEEINRYNQEYEIVKNLKGNGIITAHNIEKINENIFIVFEDFGGESLNLYLNKKKEKRLTIEEFLFLAIKIASSLEEIHNQSVIHKDINPSNIVYNSQTRQLKIIDFGISTIFPKENVRFIEGTFGYISPEQTGQMNRPLDYRTDFYSLGVTFYQLLTAVMPFDETELVELIYLHRVKEPVSPKLYNSEIPEIISCIIMKLMNKDADSRYQSASGIKTDLEKCLEKLKKHSKIEIFKLDLQSFNPIPQFKQQLYGREKEVKKLISPLKRISQKNNKSTKEIILICGDSGIGKSSLIYEIHKPTVIARGFFTVGNYDRDSDKSSLDGIVRALNNLVKEIYIGLHKNQNIWKKRFIKALGDDTQIITEKITELKKIINKPSLTYNLSSKEIEYRLNRGIRNLIKCFSSFEHPLVICLEDLQWVDNFSLQLIESILVDPEINYLLLICSYRDNEVSTTHRLKIKINQLNKSKITINKIHLLSITKSAIESLLQDTFRYKIQNLKSLAELIESRTGGYPFFINIFLEFLYDKKLIYFDNKQQIWEWDNYLISIQDTPENIVNILTDKLKQFDERIQLILKFASCFGNKFEIDKLSLITEINRYTLVKLLQTTVIAGIIVPLSQGFKSIQLNLVFKEKVECKFAHDKFQENIYNKLDREEKTLLHWKIAESLLEYKKEESLFEIVNHLSKSKTFLKTKKLKINSISLFFEAGMAAKNKADYERSCEYFEIGISLLKNDRWNNEKYDSKLKLCIEAVEAAYLNNNWDKMNQWIDLTLNHATDVLDTVRVRQIEIDYLHSEGDLDKAIDKGIELIKDLGVQIPRKLIKIFIVIETVKIVWQFKNKRIKIKDLIHLSTSNNKKIIPILTTIECISECTYRNSPDLFALIIIKQLSLLLEYGKYSEFTTINQKIQSASICTGIGILLCAISGKNSLSNKLAINLGYKFGKIAQNFIEQQKEPIKLLNEFTIKKISSDILVAVNGFINHWKIDLSDVVCSLYKAYNFSLNVCNLESAVYCLHFYYGALFFTGKNLNKLKQEISNLESSPIKFHHLAHLYYISITDRAINCLQIEGKSGLVLTEKISNNYNLQLILSEQIDKTKYTLLYLYQGILAYFFGETEMANESLKVAESTLDSVESTLIIPMFYFYSSLANIQLYDTGNKNNKSSKKKAFKNFKKLKQFYNINPLNFKNKYYLVAAEFNRIIGNKLKAIKLYGQAIESGKEKKYDHEVALASELAAKFYLSIGSDKKIAKMYIKEAIYYSERWGAIAKVKQLKNKYSNLLSQPLISEENIFKKNIGLVKKSSIFQLDSINLINILETDRAISKDNDTNNILFITAQATSKLIGSPKTICIPHFSQTNYLKIIEISKINNVSFLKAEQIKNTLPESIINHVQKTKKFVILNNAAIEDSQFLNDPYIKNNQSKSILCLPILSQGNSYCGILYFENNLSKNAFKKESIELLELIIKRCAISIENELLKQKENYVGKYYKIGGPLSSDAPSYVEREADLELYANLIAGNYCLILNARQMGKTSLRIRTADKLRRNGFICLRVDISAIGIEKITLEQWYTCLVRELIRQLKQNEFQTLNFLEINREIEKIAVEEPPINIFTYFIQEILLKNISEKIFIFIDEIDSIRSLPFSVNDFFSKIRDFYNLASEESEFKRIIFIFLGAALPRHLIVDPLITPFNIVTRIQLFGFKIEEVDPLKKGIKKICNSPDIVLKEVLNWTGGQPFLTQRICNLILRKNNFIETGMEREDVKKLVQLEIINNWQEKDEKIHLSTIQGYMTGNITIKTEYLLCLYRKILLKQVINYDINNSNQNELLTIGIVKIKNNRLIVYNLIYESIFNLDWIARHLKKAENKGQRAEGSL